MLFARFSISIEKQRKEKAYWLSTSDRCRLSRTIVRETTYSTVVRVPSLLSAYQLRLSATGISKFDSNRKADVNPTSTSTFDKFWLDYCLAPCGSHLHAYSAIYPRTDASGDVVRDFIIKKPIYPCVVDARVYVLLPSHCQQGCLRSALDATLLSWSKLHVVNRHARARFCIINGSWVF